MQLFDTIHKRKSAILTSVILLLLIFVMYGFGMKYMDPPIEYGVAINFGDSDVGDGSPVEKVKITEPKVEEIEEVKEEVQEEIVEETTSNPTNEDVLTDDSNEDVPVVEKSDQKKEVVEEEKKEEEKKEEVIKENKSEPKPRPKPSKAATDALNSLLNGSPSDGDNAKGEGDNADPGVKGDQKGDPNSNKYYGQIGGGSGGKYNLSGRKALSKPRENPDCEEEGIVVVSIKVNQNGNVVEAKPGAKGTTNSASCLFEAAKKAALKTKWNADGKAPSTQVGTIIYKFSLSK
ncbi:energy transducer TonB [Tenacibaculum sp. SZ-18]|uniref:energy transducer TonB n=1 Tax=Tenacibaculum sp. SZ-18 TaxID=754423 RepID=UPI000C2D5000|nr:energy transducer TonB [Tenacibaculum sp. SZ-18]AUC14153.1 energy transducer TonB [Tenacibaculum sp. SZ-18]